MTELLFIQPAPIASGNARDRTDRIKLGLGMLEAELQSAIDDEIWVELGYEKFADWWHGEGFEGFRLQGTLYEWAARQLKADYPDMGPRAIGRALGTSEDTAARSIAPAPAAVADHDEPGPAAEPTGATPGDQPLPFDGPIHKPERPAWSEEEQRLRESLEAGETVVLSLRGQHANIIAWAERESLYVRIDRRSDWGNPFEIPGDGDRDTVISAYAEHYLPHKASLLTRLPELRGKALGCWCVPEACHGDVLRARAEE